MTKRIKPVNTLQIFCLNDTGRRNHHYSGLFFTRLRLSGKISNEILLGIDGVLMVRLKGWNNQNQRKQAKYQHFLPGKNPVSN